MPSAGMRSLAMPRVVRVAPGSPGSGQNRADIPSQMMRKQLGFTDLISLFDPGIKVSRSASGSVVTSEWKRSDKISGCFYPGAKKIYSQGAGTGFYFCRISKLLDIFCLSLFPVIIES